MKNNLNSTHPPESEFHQYLDAELSPNEIKQFEVHLAACKVCAEELAFWQNTFARIESLPDLALSRNLADELVPSPEYERETISVLNMILAEAALGTTLAIVLWPTLKSWLAAATLHTTIGLQTSLHKMKEVFTSLFEPLNLGHLDWLGLTVENLLGESFWLPTIIAALLILLLGNGIVLKSTQSNH